MDTEDEDRELRKIAARRVRAKRELYTHLASYVVVNAALVIVWALTGAGYPWFVWPLVGWGVGVVFHVFAVLFRVDAATARDLTGDPAVERELRRLRREHVRI